MSTPNGVILKHSTSTGSEGSDGDYEVGSSSKHRRSSTSRRKKYTRSISSASSSSSTGQNSAEPKKFFDAKAYLDKRVMTEMQERFNAITMIPGMVYSVYFILAGCWLTAGNQLVNVQPEQSSELADIAREAFGNEHGWMENFGCINSSLFPSLTALPPLTVVAGALGNLLHSPFSMLYHWKYATTIEPSKRIEHWSRRLDHASIHVGAACAAYAISGRMDYFLLNAAFNLDCAYRQCEEKVRPRRNLVRLMLAILLYVLPVLVYGHYFLFLQFALMFGVGFWVRVCSFEYIIEI